MAIRSILLHPDPRLKRICAPVPTIDDRVRALMDDMLETMYEAPGIGLAAPQLGLDMRVLVMDCAGEGEKPQPMCMANPEVVAVSDEKNMHEEGCLSLPDIFGVVIRPKMVQVRYVDRDGEVREREFDGLWATCVQHEIDHLNGKLFIDYLGAARRMMITQKMKKLKRERERAKAAAS